MPTDLNAQLALRVRALRQARGLSLEALATASGVSRSMLSLIERGEASATAVVLDKIASALGIMLSNLFDVATVAGHPLSRADDQPSWRDPGSGYIRRNLSPPGMPSPLKLVAVDFPPGARVAYETTEREGPVHQQVWLMAGQMTITVDQQRFDLHVGDCLAMTLDRPIAFENPGPTLAQYLVAISTPFVLRRAP